MVYGAQRNGVMAGAIATGEMGLRSKVQILISQQNVINITSLAGEPNRLRIILR